MTATATSLSAPRRRVARLVLHRAGHGARSVVETIVDSWASFVEAGQLGPSDHSQISRHTGGRI